MLHQLISSFLCVVRLREVGSKWEAASVCAPALYMYEDWRRDALDSLSCLNRVSLRYYPVFSRNPGYYPLVT